MEKRVERLEYDVAFNPPGDGDFFYASAAKALGIETQGLKKVIFDFLKSHQLDVSIQLIANSPSSLVPLFEIESKYETFHTKMSSACSFISMQIKVIFIRIVSHLDSL